jgi:hypothetical protein
LSTPGARYITVDVGNFYLATPLDWYEYTQRGVQAGIQFAWQGSQGFHLHGNMVWMLWAPTSRYTCKQIAERTTGNRQLPWCKTHTMLVEAQNTTNSHL